MSRLLATRRARLLLTPGLFTLPPGARDESRFAQATKQMLETGDFVRIQNGTEARNRKPIGIYWLHPALCLLASGWLLRRDRRPIARAATLLAIVVALALAGAVGAILLPLLRRPGPGRWEAERRAVPSALLCMPLLYWAALGWEFPRLAPVWIAPRVAGLLPPGRLGAVGFAEPSLMFLAGTDTEWLRPEQAAQALASGEVRTLLVGNRDLPLVLAGIGRLGLEPEQVAVVRGYNYSRGRFVALTLLARKQ